MKLSFLKCVSLGSLLALCLVSAAHAQRGAVDGQWPSYGGDWGSTKYAALDQINADNVARLKVAWTWESPDLKRPEARSMGRTQWTPIMVGDTLYTSTSLCQVAAIDAKSGQTKWVFDPESYKAGRPANVGFVHRGVAYWSDGDDQRIFINTHDCYLWAIDAKTGKAAAGFGDQGRVDLIAAIPRAGRSRTYTNSSPPAICRGVVIVGSSINDSPTNQDAPRGDIQGFDARTGKPLWIFHTVPQAGEFGNETWEQDSWKYTGNTNAWTLLSADEELGYFYVPLGTPTNDWYGGHRLGDDLFAESLVCLDATSGKRVWHFQTVHHGVWDYDLPSAPILCDLTVDGRPIKAVVQLTKTGFVWAFDRTNGKPVWPVEERPVPPSNVPGERLSPTQPFPTRPAPFELQGSVEANLIDFTPELRDEAKAILDRYDHGGLFTPPTERGTINLPGAMGGANWWGASYDPETSLLYIPSINAPSLIRLTKPNGRGDFSYARAPGGNLAGPRGLPLVKPPYGKMTAINLNSGEHVWMVPNGDGDRKRISEIVGRDVGPVGVSNAQLTAGPFLTKTLLFYCQGAERARGARGAAAEATGGDVLRAFDKQTGKVVAEVPLPAQPSGTPMTYQTGGRQYIVVSTTDSKLLALALPAE